VQNSRRIRFSYFEQPLDEREEHGWQVRGATWRRTTIAVELPMVGDSDARRTVHVARFLELVFAHSSEASGILCSSFDHDFESLARHGAECAIGVEPGATARNWRS